ncbi:MAG: hypothetical protein ACM3NN_11950 [Nitrospirota bacterium]
MGLMRLAIAVLMLTAIVLPLAANGENATVTNKSGEHHYRHWRDYDHKKVVVINERLDRETTGVFNHD